MRLWSIHPKYLDAQGLVALWREALLARAVLRGETRGYRRHPQLQRFRCCDAPLSAINAYLLTVAREAELRGYRFDRSKIGPVRRPVQIPVTRGQVDLEWQHLLRKLERRSPKVYQLWRTVRHPEANPAFPIVQGPIEPWERQPPHD